jgi:hypothetical protein
MPPDKRVLPTIFMISASRISGHSLRIGGPMTDWRAPYIMYGSSMRREKQAMGDMVLPKVEIRTSKSPPEGMNLYVPIPESVQFVRRDAAPRSLLTLGLGRLALRFTAAERELEGLHCHVKTSRWRGSGTEAPPEPDAQGVLAILHEFDEGGFAYIPMDLAFMWHDGSRSLRICMSEGTALVIRVADCLLAGLDGGGRLTDIWMLDLDLELS